MMSIHEIQQLSSPAEAAASSTIEEGVSLCLLGHSEDGEQSQQEQNMDSLDLTDVFGIPPTSSSSGSGECQPSDDSTSSTSSSSSSSSSSPSKSDESSSLWLPLHQDSRDLIRRRLEKEVHDNDASHSSSGFSRRMSSTLDESTVSSTDSSCGSDSDPDSEEHDDLHNDSRKLIQLKIKRRAMCSNARTQDINDEDSDDNLSFEALRNDSLGLLKNLVSRANINGSGGIFHRFTSASNPTSGLHNDSLLGEKTRTTTHGDKRTMIGASIDQLDGDHNDSDAGDHAQNNGSSSFILDALHSHDSLRELVGDPPDAILSGTSLVTTCTINVTACKSPTSTCCCQER